MWKLGHMLEIQKEQFFADIKQFDGLPPIFTKKKKNLVAQSSCN